MRRHYGKDVYGSSLFLMLSYGYALILLFKKIHDGSMVVDAASIASITALSGLIIQSFNVMRVQWQANGAHQRVTEMKKEKCQPNPSILP